MGLKKGDWIDEFKDHPNSCRLVAEVLDGGAGFKEILCCGNTLTEKDVIVPPAPETARHDSSFGKGVIIDEKKNHPRSCGLKITIHGGGAGLKYIECCGNRLTWKDRV